MFNFIICKNVIMKMVKDRMSEIYIKSMMRNNKTKI